MTGDFLLKDFKGSQLKRSSSSIWSGDHTLGKVISDRQIMVCSTEFPSLNWHFLHRCCVCVWGGGGEDYCLDGVLGHIKWTRHLLYRGFPETQTLPKAQRPRGLGGSWTNLDQISENSLARHHDTHEWLCFICFIHRLHSSILSILCEGVRPTTDVLSTWVLNTRPIEKILILKSQLFENSKAIPKM